MIFCLFYKFKEIDFIDDAACYFALLSLELDLLVGIEKRIQPPMAVDILKKSLLLSKRLSCFKAKQKLFCMREEDSL